jgi:tetrahydromethanopterin S-methyltransferase subunit G
MTADDIVEKVVRRLESSIGETITDNLRKHLQVIVQEEFKRIDKRLDSIDRILSTLSDDTSDDRKDFGHMKVSLASIDQSLKEMMDITGKQTKTIVNKVSDKVDTIEEKVQNAVDTVPEKTKNGLQDFIVGARPKVVEVVAKKRHFRLQFWKKGGDKNGK